MLGGRTGASDGEAVSMRLVNRPLGVLGVPTSAGAFAPGQERAPRALREAGLAMIFTPGTPLDEITTWVDENIPSRV